MIDNLEIRNLRLQDDMEIVAELIMDTDPYVYGDLFGSLENAKKVLPYLFKRNTGIFKTSCYYLALEDENILGMIGLFKYGDDWQPHDVKMAFVEAGVSLPRSFEAVSEYFKGAHNYQPEVKACNVCVNKKFRKMGVGDFMVKQIIKMAGNSNVILSVLAVNESAIKLYTRNGFKVLYEYDDYGGYNKPKVKCLAMIRLHTVKNNIY